MYLKSSDLKVVKYVRTKSVFRDEQKFRHENTAWQDWRFSENPHPLQIGSEVELKLSTYLTCRITRLESHLFCILHLYDSRFSRPVTVRNYLTFDTCDHYSRWARTIWTTDQEMKDSGKTLESTATRICRVERDRVSVNVIARVLNLTMSNAANDRRVEMMKGTATEIQITYVAVWRCTELMNPGYWTRGRARLMMLDVEKGDRWLFETQSFLSDLVRAKTRGKSFPIRRRVGKAWHLRWDSVSRFSEVRSITMSLLDLSGT